MRIRDAVLAVAGRLCKYAILANPTAKGFDAIEAPEQDPDEPKAQIPARRLMWFGFRSVPPAGSECAVIAALGGASNNMLVGAENLGYGKTDMSTGEAQVYSQFKQSIFLDKDGATTSTVDAGSSIKQDKDGNIILTSKGGAKLTMLKDADTSEHDKLLKSVHFGGLGSAPTAATAAGGGALGAGGIILIQPSGSDSVFRFTAKSDPMNPPPGPGDFAVITFAKAYASAPECFIQPTNSDSATPGPNGPGGTWWYSSTTTTLTIKTSGTLQQNTSYGLAVWVAQPS